RTLNSKSLDLNIKYPPQYREKEGEIRGLIGQHLERGKVDFWLNYEDTGVSESYQINTSLVAGYYTQLKNMAAAMQIPETDWMQLIFRLPDVVNAADISIPDEEWKEVKDLIAASLKKVNEVRKAEGESLEKALNGHVDTI